MAVNIDISNPVIKGFLFYSSILVVKMLAMSLLTAKQRFRKNVFANSEDALSKKATVKYDDPDVERVRRAHQNDIENIYAFIFAGAIYILSNPSVSLAINLFRAFTAARIFHTFAYLLPLPQPMRALAFFAGYLITVVMLLHSIMAFS